MGVLTRGQTQFRDRLAARTGLNAGVITAWMLSEESGSAARSRESSGQHNWLNIGWTDSGRMGLTRGGEWSNPIKAADATAAFLKGQKYGASSGIRAIMRTAGRSPQEQMRAIAGSGWASSGYEGGSTLNSLYNQYGKGVSQPSTAPSAPVSAGPSPQNTVLMRLAGRQRKSLFDQGSGRAVRNPLSMILALQSKMAPAATATPAAPSAPAAAGGSVSFDGGPRLTNSSIVSALNTLSSHFGHISVGTTTNHSKYTVNGNVSDHYSGNAADIPASGSRLTKMGQAALVSIGGWSPQQAAQARGGIYNVTRNGKRYQIIFNTTQGGNHWNHLHIGVR